MLASRLFNFNNAPIITLQLIAYAETTITTAPNIPAETLPGDLIIIYGVDHDNGTTTTPGTTSAGNFTGFDTISSLGDAGGSDDMDVTIGYRIAQAGDAGTSIAGGPSGGDTFYNGVYVFRPTFGRKVSSVSVLNQNIVIDNTEGATGTVNTLSVNTNFTNAASITKLQFLYSIYGSDVALDASLMSSSVSGMNQQISTDGGNYFRYKTYGIADSSVPSQLTTTFTDTGAWWVQSIGSLSLTLV